MSDFNITLFDAIYRRFLKACRIHTLLKSMRRLSNQINEAALRCDYRRVSTLMQLYNQTREDYLSAL